MGKIWKNQDFLENGPKDFVNIGHLNKADDTLLNGSALMFRKILDVKLWIDPG